MINRFSKTTRVQQYVLNLIAKEQLSIGQRLPPEIQLAESIGASVITIRRAMAELVAHGIIERFQGKGTFVKRNATRPAPLGTVAFLLVNRSTVRYENLIEEVREASECRHHNIVVITTGENPDSTVATRLSGISGVVMSGAVRDEWLNFMELMHLPFVVIGKYELIKPVWNVRYDYEQAAALAVERLYKHGCRAIGLLNGARTWPPALEIHQGYRQALKKLHLPDQDSLAVWCQKQSRQSELHDFITGCNGRVDGFLVEGGCFAPLQVLFYEHEWGSWRPLLCVIGKLPYFSESTSKIFSVSFQQGLGKSAVDLLFEATAAGREGPRTVMIPPCSDGP